MIIIVCTMAIYICILYQLSTNTYTPHMISNIDFDQKFISGTLDCERKTDSNYCPDKRASVINNTEDAYEHPDNYLNRKGEPTVNNVQPISSLNKILITSIEMVPPVEDISSDRESGVPEIDALDGDDCQPNPCNVSTGVRVQGTCNHYTILC